MTITPGLSGFLKGLLLVVILAVTSYLSDAANLTGIAPVIATLVVAVASAIESSIKANSGKALFGAVRVSR